MILCMCQMCVAVCMLLCVSADMLMPQYGSGSSVEPYPQPCLRGLFHLPSCCHRRAGIIDVLQTRLYVGYGDLNSGLHDWAASTFPLIHLLHFLILVLFLPLSSWEIFIFLFDNTLLALFFLSPEWSSLFFFLF